MTARGPHRSPPRRRALAFAAAAAATLAGCTAPGVEPLADRGADGLPERDRLWVARPGAATADAPVPGPGAEDDATAPTPADRRYTVRPGDSLGRIARTLTGEPDNWRALAEANAIADPASLAVGTELLVPGRLLAGAGNGGGGGTDTGTGLLDALALAQAHDAAFRVAREQFDVARSGVPIARSALLPQAGAEAQLSRFTDFEDDDPGPSTVTETGDAGAGGVDVVPVGGSPDYTETQLSANISQALFDRAASLTLRRARLDTDVAETALLAAHEDLVVRLAQAYFDVLRSASELEFRASDLDAIRRQLQQSERRYEVGDIAITDVVEARARRDLAEAAEIDARNRVEDAREALAEITGLDPAALELAGLGADFELLAPDPADVDAWVALAEDSNLDLAAARAELEATEASVAVQRAQRLPTLSVGASVASLSSDDGPRPDGETGSVSLTGRLPLLSGGLVTAQIAQARAQARLAEERVVEARRRVTRGTRNAYRAVVAAIARVRALEQALASTRQAARATEAGFEAGTRTSVEVLESLRDTFRARSDYASARYDYIVGTLQLERAAGTLEAEDVARVGAWLEGR